jgi:hypothetical protein
MRSSFQGSRFELLQEISKLTIILLINRCLPVSWLTSQNPLLAIG